ncbi:Putative short-chain dehydrogenase/reductase SDR, NAD(P)-binding domain superfamily [Septoria linicola]|uniref:Short-chain dehydrogenase/reductase SDR, NAD(P)-binding domain superfamily n=1 Tax=Septoria linicola TaxID=215465 RepID=A0A9Q9B0P4_9PEZI|nr:putative short-chain dehydrogenase/reductase SDR, NAD(P)-binding domain superfamily [Septoria linicola]USW54161.1 Putative short-chain dehydrogenase/reductase SDR, NAD(P)-binding domain superfamily [Septoria linicola]
MTLFSGVALVTGAASGIGQATAISFIREGCRKIAIADLNASGLAETAQRMRDLVSTSVEVDIVTHTTDITRESDVEDLLEKTVSAFGRVDYAANCAGVLAPLQPSHETSAADFDKTNSINYRGCWLTSRAEIRQMLKQDPLPTHDGRPGSRGSIVNIASQLGIVGRAGAPAYCASKAAVISLTKCDAIDYSKDNIRVNCVCPGLIDTPLTHAHLDHLKAAISIAPMDRPGTAQEVADAVLFLCSSKASFVQGSALVVDGGYTIN